MLWNFRGLPYSFFFKVKKKVTPFPGLLCTLSVIMCQALIFIFPVSAPRRFPKAAFKLL